MPPVKSQPAAKHQPAAASKPADTSKPRQTTHGLGCIHPWTLFLGPQPYVVLHATFEHCRSKGVAAYRYKHAPPTQSLYHIDELLGY